MMNKTVSYGPDYGPDLAYVNETQPIQPALLQLKACNLRLNLKLNAMHLIHNMKIKMYWVIPKCRSVLS